MGLRQGFPGQGLGLWEEGKAVKGDYVNLELKARRLQRQRREKLASVTHVQGSEVRRGLGWAPCLP